MVSSVDGLAGAVRLVRQVLPQRREVASEAVQGLGGEQALDAPRRWPHFVQVATAVVPFITDHLLSPAVMRR
jgi:hypothetical protein